MNLSRASPDYRVAISLHAAVAPSVFMVRDMRSDDLNVEPCSLASVHSSGSDPGPDRVPEGPISASAVVLLMRLLPVLV